MRLHSLLLHSLLHRLLHRRVRHPQLRSGDASLVPNPEPTEAPQPAADHLPSHVLRSCTDRGRFKSAIAERLWKAWLSLTHRHAELRRLHRRLHLSQDFVPRCLHRRRRRRLGLGLVRHTRRAPRPATTHRRRGAVVGRQRRERCLRWVASLPGARDDPGAAVLGDPAASLVVDVDAALAERGADHIRRRPAVRSAVRVPTKPGTCASEESASRTSSWRRGEPRAR